MTKPSPLKGRKQLVCLDCGCRFFRLDLAIRHGAWHRHQHLVKLREAGEIE